MIYLQYASKEEARRFVNQPYSTLFGIYALISVFTQGYVGSEFKYALALVLLVIAIVSSKINVILETIEVFNFEVSSIDGALVFKRFGECVYEVEVSRVRSVWYTPHKYLRRNLVIELDNHERHSFKLPLFVGIKINCIDKLLNGRIQQNIS